jgi:hypothetical protein
MLSYFEIWGSNDGNYAEYCLLECDDVHSGWNLLTFWRNVVPPTSGSKSKPRKRTCKQETTLTIRLFFNPEDGSSSFLRNIDEGDRAPYARR